MNRDIRETKLYKELEEYFTLLFKPGTETIIDATDLSVSPDGRFAAFTGIRIEDITGPQVTRICLVDINTGQMRVISQGPNNDRLPLWSPDGKRLAFLSDRNEPGNFQLYTMDFPQFGEVNETPAVDGMVEYFSWSLDGQRILLGVAGRGADLSGMQGGGTTSRTQEDMPSWLPQIDTGDAKNLWRRAWVYDIAPGKSQVMSRQGLNVWETVWCGNERIAAVISDSHSEGAWYTASLALIDLDSGKEQILYTPKDQIGWPAASPSGKKLAVVEAVCSDRWVVCGNIHVIDTESGDKRSLDTKKVDVTFLDWRDENCLGYAGHRTSFETVIGEYDIGKDTATEVWTSEERTCGEWYPKAWPMDEHGYAVVAESYDNPPELALIKNGEYQTVLSLGHEETHEVLKKTGRIEQCRWNAPDGLEIHGYLVSPEGPGPHPLIMDIHGGPVWACRNRWLGRLRIAQPLVSRGYAVFYPNPRGSSTRGQDFARLVKGDMGGADTYDYLSGLDYLVKQGIADPERIGVTGISYGGFMSSWIITQDQRFAAAVTISPVTDWYSQHRTSQIPYFDELFLNDDSSSPGGRFFERSPVMFADRVETPTLVIAGELDQNTPPGQAIEFHKSLLEHGKISVLAMYPEAVHGCRRFPEIIDSATRTIDWFLKYIPPKS
jgi:dipeptidyl aminopeptidase/acylaminoacyl peptidase